LFVVDAEWVLGGLKEVEQEADETRMRINKSSLSSPTCEAAGHGKRFLLSSNFV
jgi:hypothetical protein